VSQSLHTDSPSALEVSYLYKMTQSLDAVERQMSLKFFFSFGFFLHVVIRLMY